MIGVPDFEGSPNTHGRNHGETQQIVGPEPTGSDFRIIIGPARLLGNAVARSTSMKPGRVKRKNREDWFTLLFEVTRVRPTCVSQVIRGLI